MKRYYGVLVMVSAMVGIIWLFALYPHMVTAVNNAAGSSIPWYYHFILVTTLIIPLIWLIFLAFYGVRTAGNKTGSEQKE